MALTDRQLEAVQLVVLDRWNPKLVNDKIAKTVGVEKSTVFRWPPRAESYEEWVAQNRQMTDANLVEEAVT